MTKQLLIVFISLCIFFISCKKSKTTADTTPDISFTADEQPFHYSGFPAITQWVGVDFYGYPFTDTSYDYTIAAGKNASNYIILTFIGPHPLNESNISKVHSLGMGYAINGASYTCSGNCTFNITSAANNMLSGTFMGALYTTDFLPIRIEAGLFQNLVIKN